MEARGSDLGPRIGPDAAIQDMPNDNLIVALLQTLNHLSRWLTPIHDHALLEFSPRRSEPSVKDILLRMRDAEERVFSLMFAIAKDMNPDLDRVPMVKRSPLQLAADHEANPLVIMSESAVCAKAQSHSCARSLTTLGTAAVTAGSAETGQSDSSRSRSPSETGMRCAR